MRLLLDRLTPTPVRLEMEGSGQWWLERNPEEVDQDCTIQEPFRFVFDAYTMGEDVYIEGNLSGALDVECSRCLSRYRQALHDRLRLVLEPARGRRPTDPEGVEALSREGLCLGDELELGWYEGSEIRLDGYFSEVVSLAMPAQPLCSESCAGLCPACGGNRNANACQCEELRPDSPFAVLEALRSGSTRGDS